jgi:hypothetical protein
VTEKLLTAAEMAGITGTEAPLTPADVHTLIEAAYRPWQVTLVLRTDRLSPWETGHMRPREYGGGWDDDGFGWFQTEARGIWARIPAGPRAGLITWTTAEKLIREAATPASTAVLIAAVRAHQQHPIKPGNWADVTEGGRLLLAEQAAWRELIRAERAEQLDLFGAAQ